MIRKFFLLCVILVWQLIFTNFSFSKVEIIASVNNEIITNYDLKKESGYLMILNPKMNELKNNIIIKLAKESLIKEIIKKEDIIIGKWKIFTLRFKHSFKNERR